MAYIVAAKRTPFGAFGGSLKNIKAAHLGAHAARAALAQLPKDTKIDSVFFGGVLASDKYVHIAIINLAVANADRTGECSSTPYLSRHVALLAGLPVETPCLTVNRRVTEA